MVGFTVVTRSSAAASLTPAERAHSTSRSRSVAIQRPYDLRVNHSLHERNRRPNESVPSFRRLVRVGESQKLLLRRAVC
jgi:hypothetical protein